MQIDDGHRSTITEQTLRDTEKEGQPHRRETNVFLSLCISFLLHEFLRSFLSHHTTHSFTNHAPPRLNINTARSTVKPRSRRTAGRHLGSYIPIDRTGGQAIICPKSTDRQRHRFSIIHRSRATHGSKVSANGHCMPF